MSNAPQTPTDHDERRPVDPDDLPDSLWVVARRPKWILALVFALIVAAVFAWLGHWQLDRSVESLKPVSTGSETRKVLSQVTSPQVKFLDKLTGQKVSLSGSFAPSDFRVLSARVQQGQRGTGYWLTGRFVDSANGGSIIVAIGWSRTAAEARAAEKDVPLSPTVEHLDGRYLPTEDVDSQDFANGKTTQVLSIAQLINEYAGFSGDVYNGYLVDEHTYGSLADIYSPPPIDKATLNWLNVFYAVEWAVFAGFAIFLWYRLVKDTYERETDPEDDDDSDDQDALLTPSGPGRAVN